MTRRDRSFYRVCAFFAFATAITTFLLWWLSQQYKAPQSFEETLFLPGNSFYMLKQWINLIHVPLALCAYIAFAIAMRKNAFGYAVCGVAWFLIWAVIEMAGVATIIFSLNDDWRKEYPLATGVQQQSIRSTIQAFYSVWDSLFFVLLIAFLAGNFFFALTAYGSNVLQKILSILFWLAVPLTGLILLEGYTKATWPSNIIAWFYPVLQPVSRILLGVFLWKAADTKLSNFKT